MDTLIEEQRAMNVQANQKIETVKSSLNKEFDGFQSEIDQKFDNMQCSISRLSSQQHVHQEEENPEGECLIDTILGEQTQLQQLQEDLIEEPVEASEELRDAPESCVVYGPWRREEEILPLLTEKGSGKEAGEEPKKLILQPIPIKLNPSATAQATTSSLPTAPSLEPMHILPLPAAHSTPKTPTEKVIPSPLLMLQKLKKLEAIVQIYSTTTKTLAVAHTAWHNG